MATHSRSTKSAPQPVPARSARGRVRAVLIPRKGRGPLKTNNGKIINSRCYDANGYGRLDGAKWMLTGRDLDQRTRAARLFTALCNDIASDLGGRDALSTVEKALVEAFAGAALFMHHINARLQAGEKIDIAEHTHAVSSLVKVASRIGIARRVKDISPDDLGVVLRAGQRMLDSEPLRIRPQRRDDVAEAAE